MIMPKKPEEQKEEQGYDIWICKVCDGEPEFTHADMMKHMHEVHHIDTKKTKAQSRMLSHLDSTKWFQSTYEVTVKDMKFMHEIRTMRSPEDMMMWM
jgi:hypothetical protein